MKKCSKCKELKSLDCFKIQKSKYNTGQLHHHCKTCIKKADRIRYEKNKDRLKQQAKSYRDSNKEAVKLTHKKYRDKQKNNLFFKLRHSIGSLTRYAYKAKSFKKDTKTQELLGCTYTEFIKYIEEQFEPWMTCENYGKCISGVPKVGWDIDHITPLAAAQTVEDLKSLCHYKNLRPLCSNYNRFIKHKKREENGAIVEA